MTRQSHYYQIYFISLFNLIFASVIFVPPNIMHITIISIIVCLFVLQICYKLNPGRQSDGFGEDNYIQVCPWEKNTFKIYTLALKQRNCGGMELCPQCNFSFDFISFPSMGKCERQTKNHKFIFLTLISRNYLWSYIWGLVTLSLSRTALQNEQDLFISQPLHAEKHLELLKCKSPFNYHIFKTLVHQESKQVPSN